MTISFHRQHEILIDAPAEAIYDFICNPNLRPLWSQDSSSIEAPDRPLKRRETFREKWRRRRGIVGLTWVVLDDDRPDSWTIRADTDFIGPIVIRYCLAAEGTATRCIEHLSNPRRPSEPSPEQLRRIDDESTAGLASLKRLVEQRMQTHQRSDAASTRSTIKGATPR
jgi:hypothetical protein